MRQFILIFSFILTSFFTVSGKSIEAYFNYCTFNSPESGPFIETYLSFIGNSIVYKTDGDKKSAKIEITLIFKEGEKVTDFKKFILSGPEVGTNDSIYPNFIDQQRFSLPNGTYELEIEITDLNNEKKEKLNVSEIVSIDYKTSEIILSDIQLIESYSKTTKPNILSKSGHDLVPYVSYFYPKSIKNIIFYAEVYNTQKLLGENEKFLLNSFIETAEKNVKISDYNSFSRKNTSEVTVVFGDFPIDKLPSGNYNLVIEARNKNNELLSMKKLFFQRSNSGVELNLQDIAAVDLDNSFVNKYDNQDTLAEYIRSIRPISSPLERTFAENQLKNSDLKLKQQFFFNFWNSRDPINPEQAWKEYEKKVKKANQLYGTKIKKGYDSDRGRIFLQYGEPNTISRQYNEPSAYPYEIWHYYHIANFNNRRFIFYNPDLATNDFPLLHSDMFGEIYNPRWKLMLHKRDHQTFDLDETQQDQHFGGNVDDFFQNPR